MSAQTCYWPNGGGIAEGYTRCDTDSNSQHSACCSSSHYCFSNGLCLDNNEMTTYRGACTDETWGSSACARYCLTTTNGAIYTGVCGVWPCGNNNQFACYQEACGNSSEMFIVNGGTIQRNAALDKALTTTSTANPSSTMSATNSATQAPSALVTSCPVTDTTCPSHTGAYAGLGAGLGIPLLIALIALVFLILQLRKHKRNDTASSTAPITEHSPAPEGAYQQHQSKPPQIFENQNYPGSGYYSPGPGYKAPMQPDTELPSGEMSEVRLELEGNNRR